MQSHTVGFVGGGRITAIFLEALGGRGLALDRTMVSDTNGEVRTKLKARFPGITATADNGEAASCERVFLALHPPALKGVLPGIAPFTRLARVLPNAPSLVWAGFNPVAFADGLPPDARAEIEALLDGLGAHPVVPEEALEAYAVLAAMGPTYFWFQWQTLRDLAASFGLGAVEADRALRAMLDGAVRPFFDAGLTAEEVLDLVPVKPLAEAEPHIRQAYLDVLPRLHAKLKGA